MVTEDILIVSDMHNVGPMALDHAINVGKSKGATKLVLNGDVAGDHFPQLDRREYYAILLEIAGRSEIETYVLPSTHEGVSWAEPLAKGMAEKYSNLVYVVDHPFIEGENHDLLFMSGIGSSYSKSVDGDVYVLENDPTIRSGLYELRGGGIARVINMHELLDQVKDPAKTIVFSHIPRKFDNINTGVDMAYFGEVTMDCVIEGRELIKGMVWPGPIAEQAKKRGYPIIMKTEERNH